MKQRPDKALFEPDGTVRDLKNLELLGWWFDHNKAKYFIPLNPYKNGK